MIQPDRIETILSLLDNGGYRLLRQPVTVAGIPFEFTAVLVAEDRAFDIVVVADTVEETNRRLRQRLEAVARALDVVGSRRTLTLVTVGPPPGQKDLESLSRVARVLVTQPQGLRDSLAVLLPLDTSLKTSASVDPFQQVEAWVASSEHGSDLEGLLEAAAFGKESVTAALSRYLAKPLEPVLSEAPDE